MVLFPTQQWFERYGRRLDTSEILDEVATGWGVGTDGTVRFVIDDIPLAETTLGDLPEQVLEDLPDPIQEGVEDVTLADTPSRFDDTVRESLPEQITDLIVQIENYIVGGTIHAQLDLHEGAVTSVEVLDAPDERDAGIVIRGPLTTWQQITAGRPTLSALLTGDLTVEGDELRVLRYSTMLQFLGDVAAAVETTHLFDQPQQPVTNAVVDAAAGSSAEVQQRVEREARRMLQDVSLLSSSHD